jgi:arachidonate 15-lipoxygenase
LRASPASRPRARRRLHPRNPFRSPFSGKPDEIYYPTAADVIGDYELQAWVAELASKQGGSIQDIGDRQVDGTPRIETAEYLAKLLTQVIFTASAQHAAVNFPQHTIMSYTPAMPLAA